MLLVPICLLVTQKPPMNLKHDQLKAHLVSQLSPAYWVSGDEPLLVQEATDAIRRAALDKGFSERHSFHADPSVDWSEVFNIAQSMGLFSERQLIEIHLSTRRPDKQGGEILTSLFAQNNPDTVFLISSSQLHRTRDKNKPWYKAFSKVGAAVEIWPVTAQQLPQWLSQRLQEQGLTATEDAIALLSERNEGNLLAAAQEVQKLALLFPGTEIGPIQVQEAVGQSSRYNPFDISDAVLERQPDRALRILQGLREEGVEPPIILWALRRDCRVLLAMATGERPTDFVLQNKRGAYQQLARHLGPRTLVEAMAQAALVDQTMKGMLPGDPWQPLTSLLLRLCGTPLARQHERI